MQQVTHRCKWAFAVVALAAAMLIAGAAPASAAPRHHIQVRLHAVGGSGVSGIVDLRQSSGSSTNVKVLAFGLAPNADYVSLYYSNHVCALEPYSVNDVIGGIDTANAVGVGVTRGPADDILANINSVSVRKADFTLVACANLHPGA